MKLVEVRVGECERVGLVGERARARGAARLGDERGGRGAREVRAAAHLQRRHARRAARGGARRARRAAGGGAAGSASPAMSGSVVRRASASVAASVAPRMAASGGKWCESKPAVSTCS
jgi:hypothetical protein